MTKVEGHGGGRAPWCRRLVLALVTLGCVGLCDAKDGGAMAAEPQELRGLSWTTVNDTVMGGRSSASLSWNDKGHLVWSGTLSLENNGGFVSIRAQDAWADWSAYDGVEVVLEGAGRDVQVSAQRQDMIVRAGGYRASVSTEVRGDTRVFIPFRAFVLKRFGRVIQGPPLSEGLKQAGRWGLLIADKRPGPFKITLKSITPVRYTDATRPKGDVRPTLLKAIEQGVPVFNSGDHAGCAGIYRAALQRLIDTRSLGVESWAHRQSRQALFRAKRQTDTDAAWTLRGAMDALLRSIPD